MSLVKIQVPRRIGRAVIESKKMCRKQPRLTRHFGRDKGSQGALYPKGNWVACLGEHEVWKCDKFKKLTLH